SKLYHPKHCFRLRYKLVDSQVKLISLQSKAGDQNYIISFSAFASDINLFIHLVKLQVTFFSSQAKAGEDLNSKAFVPMTHSLTVYLWSGAKHVSVSVKAIN
ncbi:UNVERIFIED_CONTAM: hypothetical protein NCL1_61531, partial [Trichonephila clavipes]